MSNKMKKKAPKTDAEILRCTVDSDVEAEWSEEELNSYLQDHGLDPSQVFNQVQAKVKDMLQGSIPHESIDQDSERKIVPITSLVIEGKPRGLSIVQLAAAAGLSLRLFAKLESGMLEYASIPIEIISDIGRTLGRTVEDVSNYLEHAQPNVQGASFRADAAPVLPSQQNFFVAVEEDDSLTVEQLERLHMLEAKYKSLLSSSQTVGTKVAPEDLPPANDSLRAEVREIADEFSDAFKEMKRRGD